MDRCSDVEGEIRRLHVFLEHWLSGRLPGEESLLRSNLSDRLDARFVNIQPRGAPLSKAEIVDHVRAGHGGSPEFRIAIHDVAVRMVSSGMFLATYLERQTGARNSAPMNARISSALFQASEDGGDPIWLHLQETWFPDEAP